MPVRALVLALALLVWRLGLAGVWVIAAGALGFAEAALLESRETPQRGLWRVWAGLAVRLALAAAIAPIAPPIAVTGLAILATAIAIGLMGHTLVQRRG